MELTRILVVEPERKIAADLRRRLMKMGHTVTATAAGGEQALDAAQETRPDLVFMDTMLEDKLTGVETARRLRKSRDVPVVYMMATNEEAASVPKASRPYGHVLKTFNDGELRSAIEFALYRHRIDAKLLTVERWLSTTLLSIGDAVIATDRHGSISVINAAAQRLTGWGEAEAMGQPFNKVFRVVQGDGGMPILDLIDRALLQGFSIGIDDDVWLQPLDGAAIPIDDSIAPIRDESMQVTGVVVVFRDGSERKRAKKIQPPMRSWSRPCRGSRATGGSFARSGSICSATR